ncbi:MAG: 30S ribosomal protein S1 [Candidatus Stahlbacteria bacterium]|nr:30S ribosomal protein S1 [Candidatus Stahlbacteria bacterium]
MERSEKDAILQLIEESLERVVEGSIVEGKVVGISVAEAFIDIGCKSEGSVYLSEFDDPSAIKLGDRYDFYLERIIEDEGLIFLSKRKADLLRVWDDIKKSYEEKVPLEAKVIKPVRGGCIVLIKGLEAFLPGSQIDIVEVRDMSKLVGQVVSVRVTKFDRLRTNVIVSRRALLEEEWHKKKDEIWDSVKEGEIIDGVVKNVVDFGAFVDIGGVDGLVHIVDLAWGRITHPSELLRIGDKVKVKVLGIDKAEGHLTLGIKQLSPSPWEGVEERYPVSSLIKGKITSITDYGAFIELEPGIEGLIHISEMSWTHVHSPSDILAVGDTIQVVVLNVNREEEKVALSLRQTLPNPWERISEKYAPGSIVSGTVKGFSKFGAFIELEEGIEGLLHIGDLSWTEHFDHPGDILRKRQQIKCKILNVDIQNRRITLSLKEMEDNPIIALKEAVLTNVKGGKVKEIVDKGLIAKFLIGKHRMEGFVPSNHLLKSKAQYEIGEEINLNLLEVDEERKRIILSEKEYSESEAKEEHIADEKEERIADEKEERKADEKEERKPKKKTKPKKPIEEPAEE